VLFSDQKTRTDNPSPAQRNRPSTKGKNDPSNKPPPLSPPVAPLQQAAVEPTPAVDRTSKPNTTSEPTLKETSQQPYDSPSSARDTSTQSSASKVTLSSQSSAAAPSFDQRNLTKPSNGSSGYVTSDDVEDELSFHAGDKVAIKVGEEKLKEMQQTFGGYTARMGRVS
jgi:hypothetical protein